MTIDENKLREALVCAHEDDAPPEFAAVAHARTRPRHRVRLALVPVACAAIALLVLRILPAPPPPEVPRMDMNDPLAFLLESPNSGLFGTVPRFELRGVVR